MDAYDTGVLDPEIHEPLVRDLSRIAKKANVPKAMVWTSLAGVLGEAEAGWTRTIPTNSENGCAGLVYSGDRTPSVDYRMQLIAGVCLRNFIDARYTPLSYWIEAVKKGDNDHGTVLLVPDFLVTGLKLPDWQVSLVQGALIDRFSSGLQTVLFVEDMHYVSEVYGARVRKHLMSNYHCV